MEPNAISLKTASVVPGSAFNFGPTPTTGLGLTSGLYGDKDAYTNFLDDFRPPSNYYMAAAAAAHHRTTPDNNDNKTRTSHQQSSTAPPATTNYTFLSGPQTSRPTSGYALSGHFMPPPPSPHQPPPPPPPSALMDPNSTLYRQYLAPGMLQPGLLGPPGSYPPGYHSLTIRQPYDPMPRSPWM